MSDLVGNTEDRFSRDAAQMLIAFFSGTHYFMNMSGHLPCEKIYPVFLLYDMEGNLGAFGWVFQGRPDNFYSEDGMGWFHITPQTYPVWHYVSIFMQYNTIFISTKMTIFG